MLLLGIAKEEVVIGGDEDEEDMYGNDDVVAESDMPGVFELPHKFTNREKARLLSISLPWQLMILVASIVDVIMLFVQLANPDTVESDPIVALTAIVLITYSVDIIVRLYALHFYLFFKVPANIFDFLVVFISILLAALDKSQAGAGVGLLRGVRAAYRVAIALRVLRTVSVVTRQTSGGGAAQAARNVTGENKKRFVDLQNNFDIDLTYINSEIIAMGVPAQGFTAWYRNPIGEVVRFFKLRHDGAFRIYNCCPELPYPAESFGDGGKNVIAFDIQDHTPPTMEIQIQFLKDAEEYMQDSLSRGRVIAVHCRGGKGRTGSLVTAWLCYSGFCRTAAVALEYFARARTDLRKKKSKKKLQGVDTPSQKRYLFQLESWLTQLGAAQGSGVELIAPPTTEITLRRLCISGYFARPEEESGPWVAAVHLNGPGGGKVVKVSPSIEDRMIHSNELVFDLQGFKCGGDVRITVFKQKKMLEGIEQGLLMADAVGGNGEKIVGPNDLSKRKIAGKEPGVIMYFLFHSNFLEADGTLAVPLAMMDKAFKNKKQRYREEGIAVLETENDNGAAAPVPVHGNLTSDA